MRSSFITHTERSVVSMKYSDVNKCSWPNINTLVYLLILYFVCQMFTFEKRSKNQRIFLCFFPKGWYSQSIWYNKFLFFIFFLKFIISFTLINKMFAIGRKKATITFLSNPIVYRPLFWLTYYYYVRDIIWHGWFDKVVIY